MNGAAQSMDGGGGSGNWRWRASRWRQDRGGQRQRRWRRNGRRDGGAITMRSIESAVDDSGGNGQRWYNGWQDNRASAAGQGDGVSPLAGNVGNMSATCRRQATMLTSFAPTGQFWQHYFLCVGTLLCCDFPTLAYHKQTIIV
jgi:hypothetical protein